MSKEIEMLLVGSKTKEALKSTGLNVSGEALDKLNEKVHQLVKEAQERCVNNGRKTVKATDFQFHFFQKIRSDYSGLFFYFFQ